jgi:hypothetical protein
MVEVGDAASDTPRMLALINNLRGEITMLKAQLEERTREAEEVRIRRHGQLCRQLLNAAVCRNVACHK